MHLFILESFMSISYSYKLWQLIFDLAVNVYFPAVS